MRPSKEEVGRDRGGRRTSELAENVTECQFRITLILSVLSYETDVSQISMVFYGNDVLSVLSVEPIFPCSKIISSITIFFSCGEQLPA